MCLFTFSIFEGDRTPVLSLETRAGGVGSTGPSILMSCGAMPGLFFRAFPVIGQWALLRPRSRFSAVWSLFWVVPAPSFWRWGICPLRSEWFVLRCSLASGSFVRLEWKTREGFLLTYYWQFVRTLSSIRPLLWRGSPWVSLVLLSRSRIKGFNSPFLRNGITGIKIERWDNEKNGLFVSQLAPEKM